MPHSLCTPEFQLLLSCCRVKPTEIERLNRAKAIALGINDEIFLSLVRRHLVAPIVYENLRSEDLISTQLKEQLKSIVKRNQYKSLLAVQMIVRLQNKFTELNIRALFFKGIILSDMYYADVAFRDIMDIDLWVEPSGFLRACDYLKSLGYSSNFDVGKLNQAQIDYKYKSDHHLLFRHSDPANPLIIELHWKLRDRLGVFCFDPALQYNEIAYRTLLGTATPVFSEVDNFLFLCTHGCDHAWYRLKWLFDLPQILDRISFDWDHLMKRAEILKCSEQVILTFLLLKKLFNHPLPPIVAQYSVHLRQSWSLRYIEQCILNDGNFCATDKEKILHLYYTLRLNKKGFFNKSLFMRYLTSEKDWTLLRLPESLFFLYFPLRPFLLLYRRLIKYFAPGTSV